MAQLLSSYSHGDSELLKLAAITSVLQGNKKSNSDDASDDPQRTYLYLDPKQPASATPTRRTAPFDDCILFVIGPGSYTEYQNVVSHARSLGRRVVYGASEMLSPEKFLEQLAQLGEEGAEAAQK